MNPEKKRKQSFKQTSLHLSTENMSLLNIINLLTHPSDTESKLQPTICLVKLPMRAGCTSRKPPLLLEKKGKLSMKETHSTKFLFFLTDGPQLEAEQVKGNKSILFLFST